LFNHLFVGNKWLAEGKTILDYKRERKNQLPALSSKPNSIRAKLKDANIFDFNTYFNDSFTETSFIQAKNDI